MEPKHTFKAASVAIIIVAIGKAVAMILGTWLTLAH